MPIQLTRQSSTMTTLVLMMRLLGNNVGPVTSGPAANWPVYPSSCLRIGTTLTRRMSTSAALGFFSHDDVRCLAVFTVLLLTIESNLIVKTSVSKDEAKREIVQALAYTTSFKSFKM